MKKTNPHKQTNLGNGTDFFEIKYVTIIGSRNSKIANIVKVGDISGNTFNIFTLDFYGCASDIELNILGVIFNIASILSTK